MLGRAGVLLREGTLALLARATFVVGLVLLPFTYRCWLASYTTGPRLNTTGCPPEVLATIVRDTRVGVCAVVVVMLFSAVLGGVFIVDHFSPPVIARFRTTVLFWMG